MRSLMQSVKRKVRSSELQQKDSHWDSDPSREAHILNEGLPICRSSRSVDHSVIQFNLPKLRDVPEAQRHRLLIRKLRLCSYVFEFGYTPDTPQEAKEKELKRAALLELVNHFQVFNPSFSEEELAEIFSMLRFNLFRPLPLSTQEALGDYNPEEDEPQSDSTWPHLQVVYEFLHRLASSRNIEPELLNKYFNNDFILNLLELFDSEDPRERDYLKTILHRIYGNFMNLRPFIRKAINNVFHSFVYETDRHNGIAELLEIIGSIINGFAIPLKSQHKVMLERVLLPIHKATHVGTFHAQLSYCVTQFLEKDPSLAPMIVRAVLKFWPQTCSKKEILFLNEVEEILERVQAEHLGDTLVPLFRHIAQSIRSPHFQVSERAIYIMNHDVLLRFVTGHRDILVPLLTEAMFCNSFHLEQQVEHTYRLQQLEAAAEQTLDWQGQPRRPVQSWQELGHWNPTIVDLTLDVLKTLQDMDHEGLERCSQSYNAAIRERLLLRRAKRVRWEDLDRDTHELRTRAAARLAGIAERGPAAAPNRAPQASVAAAAAVEPQTAAALPPPPAIRVPVPLASPPSSDDEQPSLPKAGVPMAQPVVRPPPPPAAQPHAQQAASAAASPRAPQPRPPASPPPMAVPMSQAAVGTPQPPRIRQ